MKKIALSITLALIAIAGTVYVYNPCQSCKTTKRVYVDVVGDLFHAGHIEFFKKARSLGDYLIVGIHPDDQVTDYKRKPILTEEERAVVINACKYVDKVVMNAPIGVTEELIKEHNINVVVHGDDFNKDTLMDQYGVPIKMGIFKTVPYSKGISTTEILERIKNRHLIAKKNKS